MPPKNAFSIEKTPFFIASALFLVFLVEAVAIHSYTPLSPLQERPEPLVAALGVAISDNNSNTSPTEEKDLALKHRLEDTPPLMEASSPTASTPLPQTPLIGPEELNLLARSALVNIFCTAQTSGSLRPITGSGVVIDPRGVVLTNAHVGQYFLLRDYPFPQNVTCLLRTGSPAKNAYTAELLYLPPIWVSENAKQIANEVPMGTGEHDYAFLLITGSADPQTPFAENIPYLNPSTKNPSLGEPMLLASYPAGFLEGYNIEKNLYVTTAFTAAQELFAFDTGTLETELFSIPGTVLSQAGSSGGAAVRAFDGTLAGVIVTSTSAETTAERDLRAISIAHIEKSLEEDGIGGIAGLLSGNLGETSLYFNSTIAPLLTEELKAAIADK